MFLEGLMTEEELGAAFQETTVYWMFTVPGGHFQIRVILYKKKN